MYPFKISSKLLISKKGYFNSQKKHISILSSNRGDEYGAGLEL